MVTVMTFGGSANGQSSIRRALGRRP
jgi:hypothetical protein